MSLDAVGMEPHSTALVLAAIGVLLATAALISPVSQRLGVPALLVVLGVGMLAGSEGLGGVPFADYRLAFRLGTIALVLILFDGGLGTPLATFRRVAAPASVLATIGVLLTAGIAAGAGMLAGVPPALAVLVGAVVSSTDAATVFAVLRGSRVRLRETTGAILEVESGLNDPMALLLTMTATEIMLGTREAGPGLVVEVVRQLGVGLVGGVVFGRGGAALMRGIALPAAGLYPVVTLAIACAAFGVTALAGGSGFLAVYVAGIVLASRPMPYRAGIRRVHDALAWLSQLGMFLLLGLLVYPSRLWSAAADGLGLGLVLAAVARPAAVLLALAPFRVTWVERGFIAWVGLRGAVPIVLATYPVLRGVPDAERIFHLVFFVVLVNSVVPGASVAWLARRCGLAEAARPAPPAQVELVSLSDYAGEFVWYLVDRASAVTGACVRDVPLGDGCVLTLIVRGERLVVPRPETQLEQGDHVCVFATPEDRPTLDLLFGREAPA